jgi:hypothetical protein
MKLQLSGGPLDGVIVHGLRVVADVDLVEVSPRRQVLTYVRRGDGALHHAAVAPVPSAFDAWWEAQGEPDDSHRALAERAWNAALDAKL